MHSVEEMKSKGPEKDDDEDKEDADVHEWWHGSNEGGYDDLDSFYLVDGS